MRLNRHFSRPSTAAALCICAGVFAGTGANAENKPPIEINLGLVPTADYAAVYLAEKRGLFAQEGLRVTVRVTPTANAVPSLFGGELQVSGVPWPTLMQAANHGIDLVVIAEADRGTRNYAAIISKSGSGVAALSDLPGKKVAVVSLHGNCDLLLNAAMRARRIDYKSVRYVTLGLSDMGGTLERGGVDAACVPEPALSAIQARSKLSKVFDLFSVEDGFPITAFATTGEYARNHPEIVSALKRALDKGRQDAHDHPDAVRAVLPSVAAISAQSAARLTLPYYPINSDPVAIQRVHDLMASFELIKPTSKPPRLWAFSK